MEILEVCEGLMNRYTLNTSEEVTQTLEDVFNTSMCPWDTRAMAFPQLCYTISAYKEEEEEEETIEEECAIITEYSISIDVAAKKEGPYEKRKDSKEVFNWRPWQSAVSDEDSGLSPNRSTYDKV